jgi:hypothetical protein
MSKLQLMYSRTTTAVARNSLSFRWFPVLLLFFDVTHLAQISFLTSKAADMIDGVPPSHRRRSKRAQVRQQSLPVLRDVWGTVETHSGKRS